MPPPPTSPPPTTTSACTPQSPTHHPAPTPTSGAAPTSGTTPPMLVVAPPSSTSGAAQPLLSARILRPPPLCLPRWLRSVPPLLPPLAELPRWPNTSVAPLGGRLVDGVAAGSDLPLHRNFRRRCGLRCRTAGATCVPLSWCFCHPSMAMAVEPSKIGRKGGSSPAVNSVQPLTLRRRRPPPRATFPQSSAMKFPAWHFCS